MIKHCTDIETHAGHRDAGDFCPGKYTMSDGQWTVKKGKRPHFVLHGATRSICGYGTTGRVNQVINAEYDGTTAVASHRLCAHCVKSVSAA